MKQDYKDMFLESASGYMMPFPLEENEELPITLEFGAQTHPMTGEKFNHQGIDFAINGKPLYAIATGLIVGAGQDSLHDNYVVAKYGKYEVKYGHISEAYTPYGTKIEAGQQIAKGGDMLHLGVRFAGKEIDPSEFLSMLYANIQQLAAMGIKNMPIEDIPGSKGVKTAYDPDKDSILMMMLRWLPNYMNDIRTGAYRSSSRTESTLRNILTVAADKNYYFENIPTINNPLGLSSRSVPLIEKIQSILIEDFLSYMALNHNIFPASWDNQQKKNFLIKYPQTD